MKRNLLLFLLLAMTAVHLCGCKSDSNTTSETTKHPDPEVEVQENKTDNEEEPALNIPDLETTIFSEIERDAKLNLSDFNLNQYGFRFGNNKYTLPFSYARISKKWKFTPEYYGLDENFRLQPGQKTSENLILTTLTASAIFPTGSLAPWRSSSTGRAPTILRSWTATPPLSTT